MGSIYRSATYTVAWVADYEGIHSRLLYSLELFHRTTHCDAVTWWTILTFFENPYWRRIWIIQELAFGRNVQVIYGSANIPFSHLERTITMITKSKDDYDHDNMGFRHVENIKNLRSKIDTQQPVRLIEALGLSHRAECSDLRDRVYGLCGLVSRFLVNKQLILIR